MINYRKSFTIFGAVALSIAVGSFWLAYETPVDVSAATADVIPDATASVSNSDCTTGNAHTTMDDDPDSPGGDWCNATADDTDHTIRVNMATPLGNPVGTTDAQTFKIYVRKSATGGGDPDVELDLYCNGSLVEAGTAQAVTSTTGQLITELVTFNSGSCAIDGSDVEILITCSRSGGAPSSRRSCDFDAVEWVSDYSEAGAKRAVII